MKENCARVCGLCSSIGEAGKNCVDKAGYGECSLGSTDVLRLII